MGIFSKQKDAEAKDELPPLKFPELPSERRDISAEEENTLKEAISPRAFVPEFNPTQAFANQAHEEKPLFVKIEKYREVMSTLGEIKGKLKDAGDILMELNRIKEQEDKEIVDWHNDLENIKAKLLSIDRALFEL